MLCVSGLSGEVTEDILVELFLQVIDFKHYFPTYNLPP